MLVHALEIHLHLENEQDERGSVCMHDMNGGRDIAAIQVDHSPARTPQHEVFLFSTQANAAGENTVNVADLLLSCTHAVDHSLVRWIIRLCMQSRFPLKSMC